MAPDPKRNDIAARKTALDILNTLERCHDLLDTVVENFAGEMAAFSSENRRLTHAIVFGVLRWRRRLDWMISQKARLPLDRISPDIRNILRIALFQMLFMDRIPDFAAVDTAVEIAKGWVSVKSSRFVNALLRNTLRSLPFDLHKSLPDDPMAALGISQSFPDRLIHRWVDRFGMDETRRLCEAMNQIPPVTIRTNTLRTSREALREMLDEICEKIYATAYVPEGLSFYGLSKPIDQLTAFQKGLFQVQDEAAQAVAHCLSPRPNEMILDACAGMGGKTGHIAQLMGNAGKVFAIDKDKDKLRRLSEEMGRLGITSVNICQMDLAKPIWQTIPEAFDRVLLDAPCSGLGVIRRNPDIKWAAEKRNLDRFAGRQLSLLDAVSQRVAPAGVLVYAVCTMEPEETDGVVEKFLSSHPQFDVMESKSGLAGDLRHMIDDRGAFRSFPHIHHMEGFFAVRLRRRS